MASKVTHFAMFSALTFSLVHCSFDESIEDTDALSEIGDPTANSPISCAHLKSTKTFRRDELGDDYKLLLELAEPIAGIPLDELDNEKKIILESLEEKGMGYEQNKYGHIGSLSMNHGLQTHLREESHLLLGQAQNLDSLRYYTTAMFAETYNSDFAVIYSPGDSKKICHAKGSNEKIVREVPLGNILLKDDPPVVHSSRTYYWPETFYLLNGGTFTCDYGLPLGYTCEQ